MKAALIGAVMIATLAGTPAFAQNLVKNGGFETASTTSSNGDFQLTAANTYGSVSNWATTGQYNILYHGNATTSASNAAGDFSYTGKEYLTPGTEPAAFTTSGNFLALDGDASSGAVSAVTQTLVGLTAGQAYTLSFDWAAASLASRTGALTDGLAATIAGQTFTTGQAAVGSGLQHASYTFVYSAGASTVLSFLSSGTPNGAPPIALLDNVSLIAAVPEPTTWAMMLIGFGMIGAVVRRRQRQPVMAAA